MNKRFTTIAALSLLGLMLNLPVLIKANANPPAAKLCDADGFSVIVPFARELSDSSMKVIKNIVFYLYREKGSPIDIAESVSGLFDTCNDMGIEYVRPDARSVWKQGILHDLVRNKVYFIMLWINSDGSVLGIEYTPLVEIDGLGWQPSQEVRGVISSKLALPFLELMSDFKLHERKAPKNLEWKHLDQQRRDTAEMNERQRNE